MFVALCVIFLGANVTTTASGDAIPTWPHGLSFETAKEAVEMTHRVAASLAIVGSLVLFGVAWQARKLLPGIMTVAKLAVGLVILQAVIGGIRIYIPAAALKVTHATLGQVFLCLAVVAAALTSEWWRDTKTRMIDDVGLSMLRACGFAIATLLLQVLLGALGRHDVIPREVHAVFALVVLLLSARLVIVATGDVPRDIELLRGPAGGLGFFAALQLVLGIGSYIITADPASADPDKRSLSQVITLNIHVIAASAMLGLSVLLLFRTIRIWGLPTPERVEEAKRAASLDADAGSAA